MRDLASLTPEDFERLVGTAFAVDGEATGPALQLVEVVRFEPRPGRRVPFTLRFSGPQAPVLEPETHRLRHPELGEIEIFLGPVVSDAADVIYEAVFA